MSDRFRHARDVLRTAVDARAFPAAVVEVGTATGVLWREPFGTLTYEPDAPPATDRTIFDLASLTKVIATGSLAPTTKMSSGSAAPAGGSNRPSAPVKSNVPSG